MQTFEITQFGLENLKPCTRPEPPMPGPGEVLVQIKAASLNYRDLMMVKGDYNAKQPLPLIPVSDGVGEVIAVGKNVLDFKLGDRVCASVVLDWESGNPQKSHFKSTLGGPIDGVLCEKHLFPASSLFKVPDYLSNEEASTLPCAALTAYRALFSLYDLKAGETVLLQGTGGVSLFALQLAKAAGAQVILLSSSDEKLEKSKKLGADLGINYIKNPNWGKGLEADVILELGGASTIEQSIQAVRSGGQINLIGRLGGGKTQIDLVPLFMRQIRLQGIFVGPKEDSLCLNRLLEKHQIRPIIDRVFDFEHTREAFEYLESGKHMGKVVIQL